MTEAPPTHTHTQHTPDSRVGTLRVNMKRKKTDLEGENIQHDIGLTDDEARLHSTCKRTYIIISYNIIILGGFDNINNASISPFLY